LRGNSIVKQLEAIDIIVIVLYFTGVLGVAAWAFLKNNNEKESEGYFLAGRDLGWFAVGTSLFMSNIGSEHLLGLSGTGAASGLAVGHFEWLAALILLLLGWLFVPFYLRSGVYTMPEFLGRRYNSACQGYFTAISIIGYVLTKISVSLYAGGVIIQEVTGIDLWMSAGVIVVVTGLYTVMGGLRAVVYTDMLQTGVLLIGSCARAGLKALPVKVRFVSKATYINITAKGLMLQPDISHDVHYVNPFFRPGGDTRRNAKRAVERAAKTGRRGVAPQASRFSAL
jgi:Na+/proline symporter